MDNNSWITSDLNFIDAHVHFWHPQLTPRAVTPLVKLFGFSPKLLDVITQLVFPSNALRFYGYPRFINRPYLVKDFVNDYEEHKVAGLVHVEAGWECKVPMDAVNETIWLTSISHQSKLPIKAIIAHADLGLGKEVKKILEAHLQVSKLVKGIRQVLLWHPDKRVLSQIKNGSLMRNSKWRSGFEQLAHYDLSFETVCFDSQLDEFSNLAHSYPEMSLTLCHLGMPIGFGGRFDKIGTTQSERYDIQRRWKDSISKLAQNSNVSIKLSGLGSPPLGFGYEHRLEPPSFDEIFEAYSPLINFVIEAFGVERCMFASNFPVDKVSISLSKLYSVYHIVTSNRTDHERKLLFGETARKIYRID